MPQQPHNQAAGFVLADLEHVFRIPGNPVRLPAAELEHEPHLPDAGRVDGRPADPVGGGAAYGADRAAASSATTRIAPGIGSGAGGRISSRAPLLASFALIAMPRSPVLWIAAGLLWILDASINIAMEPFRAFVGDQLPERQRPAGYAMQSFFIGVGAVIAGVLPLIFAQAGVSNVGTGAGAASIPDTVRYSFEIGAVVLAGRDVVDHLHDARVSAWRAARIHGCHAASPQASRRAAPRTRGHEARCGSVSASLARCSSGTSSGARSSTSCCGLFGVWGAALLINAAHTGEGMFATLMRDIDGMPARMRQLIPVQFFSWLALFAMWLFTNPAVTQVHFHATDTTGAAYNEGANWVGVLFSAYSGFAALAAIVIPDHGAQVRTHREPLHQPAARRRGTRVLPRDPRSGLAARVDGGRRLRLGVDRVACRMRCWRAASRRARWACTWASSISSSSFPQLVAASVLSDALKPLLGGQPIYVLLVGGVSFALAGVLALRVK